MPGTGGSESQLDTGVSSADELADAQGDPFVEMDRDGDCSIVPRERAPSSQRGETSNAPSNGSTSPNRGMT